MLAYQCRPYNGDDPASTPASTRSSQSDGPTSTMSARFSTSTGAKSRVRRSLTRDQYSKVK